MSNDGKIKPWMWREAVRNSPKSVSSPTRLLLLVLADFLDYDDIASGTFVGVEKLIAQTGLSNRAVSNHLEHARRAGLLAISGRESDEWRTRKRTVDRNGRFAVTRYCPRFPEWAQSRLRERLEEAKSRGANNIPRDPGSRGPRERGSRGPREPDGANHVNQDHATYITTNIDSTDSAKGALTRANDLKSNLEKREAEPNPVIARGLSELAHSLRDPAAAKRTAASIDSSRLRSRPVVIQKTNPYWQAWIEYHTRMGRDDLAREAQDSGKMTVASLCPPVGLCG